ncbi:unnamed protein product [Calypogeia fissa]
MAAAACSSIHKSVGSVEVEFSSNFWMRGKSLRLDTSYRKGRQGSFLAATARSKTKKGQKDPVPVIPQRDLLAQVRNRKKLSWLLREQQLSREDSEVEKVWPFWRKKSKDELAARAVTIRIMQLSKRKQVDQVFDLLKELKTEGRTLCIIIMNAVVEACVQCNDIERAITVYREMLQPDSCGVDNITYGILLKGLGEALRLDDAFELLEEIEAGTAPGNPVLSDVHLNTLVNACVEAGDSLRARGALLRYRSSVQGSRPSILTYNLLIKGFARSGNPLEALKVREEMINNEVQPQRLTYNTLIFACVRGGDMEKALELFAEMKVEARRLKTSRLLPDVVTYTTILKGLADSGNFEGVSNLVAEMKSSPTCVLDRVAYTAIIDALIFSGSPEEGLRFFVEEMKERAKVDPKFKPKAHVYLALMRGFARNGDLATVKSLRQQMVPESAGKVCPEDRAEADELIIETAVNAGQLSVARQTLKTMVGIKKGIPLSNRAHMAIVRLQALLGFSQDLFKPFLLKPGVSLQDTVESIMIPYEKARALHGDFQVKSVIMRFFKEDFVPIIDNSGACVGIVHCQDCVELDVRLRDIMRNPPPEVTESTPVVRAINLLLQPQVEIVVVVSNRTTYSSNTSFSKEVPLGFITREAILSRNDSLLPLEKNVDQQSKQLDDQPSKQASEL